ncbi:MAG: hypothetical protein KC502_00285 [Myxococcales bacterium]|nr:hypothetical protein [Myxococcales bacterium]
MYFDRLNLLVLVAFIGAAGLTACGEEDSGPKNNGAAASGDGSAIDFSVGSSDAGEVDVAATEDAGPPDAGPPEEGTFGAPCKSNEDCDTSLCVQNSNGKVCTQICEENCPNGFSCAEKKTSGGDIIYLCLPKFLYLCDPCTENKDCNDGDKSGNVCVSFGNSGSYCGIACDEVKPDCPGNYSCQQVVDPKTGLSSNQCVREAGICQCSQRAIELGLKTSCTNKNLYGSCTGDRSCEAGGLSQCKATVPKAEECNGVDDDCDGDTDNFDATAPCKKTNQFGSCTGVVIACVDGKTSCDAPAAKPEKCNGIDDDCDGETDEGLCDDGDPCTKDTCNTDGSCKHKELAGLACDDGSLCTQTDKCIAGKCIGGNALACDDNDPCTKDSCDPFTGCVNKASSDAVCPDDGKVCTQDLCKNGKCTHPQKKDGSKCADDGQVCTTDTCTAGSCGHKPSSGTKCEDGNPCTQNDLCNAGKCLPGPINQCDDKNPCTKDLCNPKVGCQHTNSDYTLCKAPSADCPVGTCSGGKCFSKPNEPCSTKVKVDLCGKVDALGTCASSGKCVAKKVPQGYSCPGCKSVCIKCFGIPVCLDFLISSSP